MNRMNSTRFMTQDELAKGLVELDMHAQQYPVGGVPMLVKGDKIYIDAQDSHTMIFGATGSKKTRNFVMPSIGILARAGESFVVTDPKGELYEKTIADVVSHGYKCSCLNLRNFRAGITWNPLALPYYYYHNGKKAKAIEFATEMAKMIIGENSTEEVFWSNTAIDVFSGFILLLFEKSSAEECHLKSLFTLWNSYISNRKAMIRKIKEEFPNTVVYQKISSLDNPSEKTVGSIEAFIAMGMNKLCLNEEFVEFLSQKGLDFYQLAKEKTAIYLVIPDENTTYHFIVSLFLEQLYEVLIDKAQKERPQGLPIRMNFLIDEFANIPKINNMDAMITAARSRNIRFHLIVQGMKQLEQKYGDGADTISGNCNNWIYLYSKEFQLLQEISRLCGEVIYDNQVRMPLFSEFDLQHLSKTEGEALVLAGRNYPCLSNLADIDTYSYTKVLPETIVQLQPWREVSCFHWEKDQKDNYSCEIYYDSVEKLMQLAEGEQEEDDRRWLVAVGPEGMIMAEGTYKKNLIETKAAMGAMICGEISTKELEPELLEWYSTKPSVKSRFIFMQRTIPANVYATLDELGAAKLKKEARRSEQCNRMESVRESEMQLVFTDDVKRDPHKQVSLGTVKAYRGNVGMKYMLNKAFRKANEELAGSEFEYVPWKFFGKDFYKDRSGNISVYKKK